jgi:hypothetical protein
MIQFKAFRKSTKNVGQHNQSLGHNLNPGHPEYESGLRTTQPHEISSSHGGEYEVQICLLGCTAV